MVGSGVAEFTEEMRGWLRAMLLQLGVPEGMVYDDPRMLVWQFREHVQGKVDGIKWLTAKTEGPPPPSPVEPFPTVDLLDNLLMKVFVPPPANGFILTDTRYEITTLDEMRRFWEWYQRYWLPNVHPVQERFDCDDYALVFAGMVSAMAPWAGLPVGEISGVGSPFQSGDHAFNIFAAKDGGVAKLYYLDTQAGRLIEAVPTPGFEVHMVKI